MKRATRTTASLFVASLAAVAACGSGCGSNADRGNKGGDAGSGANADDGPDQGFGDDGSSGGDGSASCASVSKKAEKVPVDMVIGLDTSFSMDFDDKWTNVKSALESFVNNPAYADLGIGLQFFPIRKQCSVSDYETLAVDLGPEPQVASPITQALDAQMMAGGTPTVPLLQGLVGYMQARPNPTGRKQVIVLATDGVPDDTCLSPVGGETPNTLDNAIAVAAAAFAATPSIPTFVIGVGTDLSALNGLAAAGGTGTATLVDTGANAQQQFLNALDAARKSAIPCNFAIPPGTSVDPTETNVQYAPASGGTQTFLFVGDGSSCSKAPDNGWYFDDPTAPTQVILCPGACGMVKADDRGQVNVVFGCPRVEAR